MKKNVIYIALDVDDKNFTAHGICDQTGEIIAFKCRPYIKHLIEKLKKHVSGYTLKICYESTYLGFSLARDLIKAGYHCDVIASSLIPSLPSDRVKTDRLDAEKMSLYYKNGLLTIVNIPDEEDEVVRQLIRFRKSLKGQIKEMKNRLLSQGKIFGVEIPKSTSWTLTYSDKLLSQFNELKSTDLRGLLLYYRDLIDAQHTQLERVEKRIEEYSQQIKYKSTHDSLICLRGIKTLTAMTLATEIGDINRFSHPKKLVSYVGLDIAEYSSGGKEKKLGITKAGNSHIRSCVVESQQILARRTSASQRIKKRREGAPQKIISIAIKCDDRLYKRSRHLMAAGKHSNKVKVACAREMIGFIWEVMKNAQENKIKSTKVKMINKQ